MPARPEFTPFDESEAVLISRRNLPHWQQQGATYFVTFRSADALPKGLVEQWDEEKRTWLAAHGIAYRPNSSQWRVELRKKLPPKEQFEFERTFNRKLNDALDRGSGSCVLRADPCLTIFKDRLFEGDGTYYSLGDFVLMPNHVHLLLKPSASLSESLRWIKGGSAISCNRVLGRKGKLWQRESYDHIVRNETELHAFRKYIRENPEKAGIRLPEGAYYQAPW